MMVYKRIMIKVFVDDYKVNYYRRDDDDDDERQVKIEKHYLLDIIFIIYK